MTVELHEMDCRLAMSMLLDAESIDSVVCDPPYGLSKEPDMAEVLQHWLNGDDYVHSGSGFMGKSWDSFVPGPSVWREAYRVLKPGGYLVAFFGTRTYDMGVLAIRLAGFEIRDQTAWMFGSGFPKSHDVSKGIDKALGAARAKVAPRSVIGHQRNIGNTRPYMDDPDHMTDSDEPATPEAAKWQGWGTAAKPAFEPIVIARKPLAKGLTVAANVLRYGTGAINIDGCRVGDGADKTSGGCAGTSKLHDGGISVRTAVDYDKGRWPANLVHDGSPEVVALFPDSKSGAMKAGTQRAAQDEPGSVCYGAYGGNATSQHIAASEGSAARFFQSCPLDESDDWPTAMYAPKASKADRNAGLDDAPDQPTAASQFRPNHAEGAALGQDGNPYGRWTPTRNNHPTVKPTALMQWLVRLVTPPGGTVLDPFMGSGSTGVAAVREGFSFVGCEMTPEYMSIARARIDHAVNNR